LGPWMFPVFMVAAFAAMFSTVYSVMDGFPRAFSSLMRTIFPRSDVLHRPSDPSYWVFMVVIFAFSLVTNTLLPNPVLVVTLVGVVSLMVAPVLYGLNYYCVTRLIGDEA
ncbi:MAG: divalent metal cation transporter, partial [Gemmatimonadetes bacterium]|nr:divalent metal cation transporter [Gemmatimonadota bacterium]NIQ57051.1 divalent metal cation transporter [Gemmatimonadota bacterium]NIR39155.1 divalent metal cation transporter [Actinomycetota bacterium]NIU77225.1 divalent metal cation transporter [Gammaproteobacteria bacterium]NIX46511.1 divalent metal cation transporter [Gemmatimonadota bacterium]